MSMSYGAGAFYGTWVARDSKVGDRLDEMIHEHGGTICPIKGHPQVGLDWVGELNGGRSWIAIRLKQPGASFGRHDTVEPPTVLEPQCLGTIEAALRTLRINSKDVATIGWYFAGTVS